MAGRLHGQISYRIDTLGDEGRPVSCEWLTCEGEADVIARIRARSSDKTMEILDGVHQVARLAQSAREARYHQRLKTAFFWIGRIRHSQRSKAEADSAGPSSFLIFNL